MSTAAPTLHRQPQPQSGPAQQQSQPVPQRRPAYNLYDRAVQGVVELVVAPNSEKLTEIRLNCQIQSVYVNDHVATFQHVDPLDQLFVSRSDEEQFDVSCVAQVRYRQSERIFEGNQGELHIQLPSSVSVVKIKNESMDTTENTQPTTNKDEAKDEDEYEPFTVRVEYRLDEPQAGLFFVLPDPIAAPNRPPTIYTSNQRYPGAARLWMPCLDRIDECGIWELVFQFPAYVEGEQDDDTALPVSVACVGKQVEEIMDEHLKRKRVKFELNVPISAPMISFAIGCMEVIDCNMASMTALNDSSPVFNACNNTDITAIGTITELTTISNHIQSEVPVKAYCPIGKLEQAIHTCRHVAQMMQFFVKEISSYPFPSCQIVFVDELCSTTLTGAGLIIVSKDIIEQGFDSIRILALSLAIQWFGVYITPASNNDAWLVEGLAEYLCAAYLKKRLGNNEYRFRLKKDMERVCEMDVDRPPIARFPLNRALSTDQLAFIRLKSPLVLFMLNKRMLKGGPSLGLNRVIPKMILSAMNGELGLSNAVSTTWFLRTCRKGSILNAVLLVITFSAGCPVFYFKYAFNRKKMVVEITMEQASTADQGALALGEQVNVRNSTVFTGQMTVSVQEADGTLYEHVLDIQENHQKFEVQFNTKYKRIRRTTKRFQARQAAAAAEDANAAAEVAAELQEGEWIAKDDEEAKRAWRIVEWGEEEEDVESTKSGTFEWIRMDSDFEWLCTINFYQPGAMCSAQLLKERDVIAQYEAAVALGTMPSTAASTSLTRAVMDPKCFYRVRMEAALSLAKAKTENIGFHHLIKIYEWRYGFSLISLLAGHATMPKPNDFSNVSEYFVQKAIIVAMARIKDSSGLCLPEAIVLLLHLLRYNDNSENTYSDSDFIATLISALASAFTHRVEKSYLIDEDRIELLNSLAEDSIKEMERHRSLDAYLPSFHNAVTVSYIQAMLKLTRAGYNELDPKLLIGYSRYGNFIDIRMAAISALSILAVDHRYALLNYILAISNGDPHPAMRVHAAYSLAEAYTWLMCHYSTDTASAMNDTKASTSVTTVNGTVANRDKDKKAHRPKERILEALKKIRFEIAQHKEVQQQQTPLLDDRIRRQVELLCEILYEQTVPIVATTRPGSVTKLKIRVPSQIEMEKVKSAGALSATTTTPITLAAATINNKNNQNATPQKGADASGMRSPVSVSIKRKKPSETASTGPSSSAATKTTNTNINTNSGTSTSSSTNAVNITNSNKKHITGQRGRPVVEIASSSSQMNMADRKRCMRILMKLVGHPSALLFNRPVDPKLDGCPTYYDIVKHPMDLLTIRKKLDSNAYPNKEAFAADVRLMVNNCFLFNPPGTPVYNQGMQLEDVFDEQWSSWTTNTSGGRTEEMNMTIEEKPSTVATTSSSVVTKPATERISVSDTSTKNANISTTTKTATSSTSMDSALESESANMTASEQTRCESIISKLMAHRTAGPFLLPVDPVALGIPNYFAIVKSPMDLTTVKRKLDNGIYTTVKALDTDIRLIFSNCRLFNPPDSWIYGEVKVLEAYYNGLCKRNPPKRLPKSPVTAMAFNTTALSTPPPPAPPSLPVGLTNQEKILCRKILRSLLDKRESAPFHMPVDPVAMGIPDYPTIVTQPMDFLTVDKKLEAGDYQDIASFEADIRLIFANCRRYNGPAHVYSQFADNLEKYLDLKLRTNTRGKP
ncbi:hypothetical protein BDF19DRAFT_420676 [Syncephalis fuscata]|nr:hypothetical protein BDF19DRAFT_420676 [Syncephalis fuscata]